jgi:translation initiation factor 2B subunit (eIF-2B alpha/beta/delta family)
MSRMSFRIDRTILRISSCVRKKLINRGEQFTRKTELSRKRISRLGEPFIRDDSVVLLHGFSRVVLAVLMEALEKKKRFKVILTESRPESNCQRTLERLLQKQISVTLIPDTTVAYIMDQVTLRLLMKPLSFVVVTTNTQSHSFTISLAFSYPHFLADSDR